MSLNKANWKQPSGILNHCHMTWTKPEMVPLLTFTPSPVGYLNPTDLTRNDPFYATSLEIRDRTHYAPTRREARESGRSECVVRRCWTSGIRERCHLGGRNRLRTPLTDQSSRRPPHRKKGTRTANRFIDRHPGTDSTFTGAHVSSRTIRRPLAEGHLGSQRPLRVLLPLRPPIDTSV
ncbi:uncharacterized protein TNCV_1882931 [Trichonephila clavipes]|nr:uncharacterized protein TNCV_1882931 [Trichonephila clavipes]